MSEPVLSIPRPSNESQHLDVLRRLGILGTPPEERFDRIVRLATSFVLLGREQGIDPVA